MRPVSCELVGGSKVVVRKLVEGQPQPLQTMQTQLIMSSVAGEWCSLSCVVCVDLSQSAYMRVCVCRGIAWM